VALDEPVWHPEASAEAEEARDWYNERRPLAAHGFLLALREATEAVVEAPTRWPKHRHGCRRYLFPNQYPYSLIYRLQDAGEVVIVAVTHHHRRPDYWKHR
jgi:plasmid stabilization system protein ParE